EARFPDMIALLAALRRAARPRIWLRTVVGVAVLGAVGLSTLAAAHAVRAHRRDATCGAEAAHVLALFGADAKQAIHASFAATKLPIATTAEVHAGQVLARYADTLATRTRAACEVDAPAPIGPARERCLRDRAAELGRLVTAFEHPSREVVQNAPASAWSLVDPAPCDDNRVLLASPTPIAQEDRAS